MRFAPGIRPRTVLCSRSALAAEILPVPRIIISSGFCSVVSCNSGMGIAFAAIIPPGFLSANLPRLCFKTTGRARALGLHLGLVLNAASIRVRNDTPTCSKVKCQNKQFQGQYLAVVAGDAETLLSR